MQTKTYTVTTDKDNDVQVPTVGWMLNTLEAGHDPQVIGVFSTPEKTIGAIREYFGLSDSIKIMIGAHKTAYEQVELTAANFPHHHEFTIGNPADSRFGKSFCATIYPIKEVTVDKLYLASSEPSGGLSTLKPSPPTDTSFLRVPK